MLALFLPILFGKTQEVVLMNVFLVILVWTSFFTFPMPQVGIAINVAIAVGMIVVALIILKVSMLWGAPNWN